MNTISLCMIVKNEEAVLARCLDGVKEVVDEIIIADTGSTDRTKEIALSYGAKVFDFEWMDHFADARNFSFSQASCDFILWLDADDIVRPQDQQKMLAWKNNKDFTYDSVTMQYVLSESAEGMPTHQLRRNRLVRRICQFQWFGAVHEYLQVGHNCYHSDIAIYHHKDKSYTDRNLQIYLKQQQSNRPFTPRDTYYFANELRDHARYSEAIEQYTRFLDEGHGWVEDKIGACHKRANCYERISQQDKALSSLFEAMVYDLPRAETCCRIGAIFFARSNYHQATYWYRLATLLDKPKDPLAMLDEASWTWLPHLQLCCCYDKLGDDDKALIHHQLSKSYYPDHPSIVSNEQYFQNKRSASSPLSDSAPG